MTQVASHFASFLYNREGSEQKIEIGTDTARLKDVNL